jgi:hypothetical protein
MWTRRLLSSREGIPAVNPSRVGSDPTTRTPSVVRRMGEVGALAMLGLFAVAVCMSYGRLGFMPLDQSIVFDGGWRVLSGQRPFRDFSLPAGLVPIVVQAAFFHVLGTTWFAYCLHAALINAAFAWLVYALLRDLETPQFPAWGFAGASAIFMYPPVGVPYPDQHSFFFSLACLWATVRACRPDRSLWWTPAALALAVLAFFSKPIPATFVVPCCGVALVVAAVRNGPAQCRALGFSVVAVVGVAVLLAAAAGVSVAAVFHDAFVVSARTFSLRNRDARFVKVWNELQGMVPLAAPWLLMAANVIVLALVGTRIRRSRSRDRSPWTPLLLGNGLVLTTALFVEKTANEAVNGLAWVALAVGMAWLAVDRALAIVLAPGRGVRLVGWCLVLGLVAHDAWRFNAAVNAPRTVHGILGDADERVTPGGRLGYMQLTRAWPAPDLSEISRYIRRRGRKFFLIGDSSVLYGATGQPSIFPALWFHPGLTYPDPATAEFPAFEQRLLDRLDEERVAYILLEDAATTKGTELDDFPRVAARAAGCTRETIGTWTVVELCR